MTPLKQFKQQNGITELIIMQGKGRRYMSTPKGTIYFGKTTDVSKPCYVIEAAKGITTAAGDDLEGSLWLCNSSNVKEVGVL